MIKTNEYSIGILGGTFDPPHDGHLKISKISIKKLGLGELIWAVTKKNPFKKKSLYSLKKRIEKCKNLTKKIKKIKIKYFDQTIGSTNTIDLIKHLKKKNTDLFFIIGSDNLTNLHKWKSWKLLTKLTKIVVFSSKDYDAKAKKSVIVKSVNKKKIIFINNKNINISSTQIRQSLLS